MLTTFAESDFFASETKSVILCVLISREQNILLPLLIPSKKYNGDEMVCIIEIKEDCYCSFIDNWDNNWEAFVNGNKVNIEKLFGTFKSVKLEKGRNTLVFRYNPALFGLF